ncbi:MAG: hypothetical protein ACRDL5_09940 [Solirubrobacteraceae bacterium]
MQFDGERDSEASKTLEQPAAIGVERDRDRPGGPHMQQPAPGAAEQRSSSATRSPLNLGEPTDLRRSTTALTVCVTTADAEPA